MAKCYLYSVSFLCQIRSFQTLRTVLQEVEPRESDNCVPVPPEPQPEKTVSSHPINIDAMHAVANLEPSHESTVPKETQSKRCQTNGFRATEDQTHPSFNRQERDSINRYPVLQLV